MGMSALALYMKSLGHDVSGSDMNFSSVLSHLQKEGVRVYQGSRSVKDVDIVVRSSAVKEEDLEITSAYENGIKILERMEFFARYVRPSVGVTGTDGKSSTTHMISWIASRYGLNPTALYGALSMKTNSNFIRGGKFIVAEIDESDPEIKNVKCDVAVLTNLRYDHLERYLNERKKQYASVKSFLDNAKFTVVPSNFEYNGTLTFGANGNVEYQILDSTFDVQHFSMKYSKRKIEGKLPVLGAHQVENAAAAVGASILLGIDFEDAVKMLESYSGLKRRLEVVRRSPVVISDYAHTPSEIAAAMGAVLPYFNDVVIVFEPHRYSRFKREFKNFLNVLSNNDKVVVTEIFGAFEEEKNVSVREFVSALKARGVDAKFCENCDAQSIPLNGDAYLFLGAGKIDKMAREFAKTHV